MDIWAVMGQKGGTGKTMIGTNLSVEAERRGHTVALIDLDPQATAGRWSDYRESDTPAVITIPISRLDHWVGSIGRKRSHTCYSGHPAECQ